MLGGENVMESLPLMGEEDFSFFAEAIPGYFYFLGMQDETQALLEPGNSLHYTVNEDALPYGAYTHHWLQGTSSNINPSHLLRREVLMMNCKICLNAPMKHSSYENPENSNFSRFEHTFFYIYKLPLCLLDKIFVSVKV